MHVTLMCSLSDIVGYMLQKYPGENQTPLLSLSMQERLHESLQKHISNSRSSRQDNSCATIFASFTGNICLCMANVAMARQGETWMDEEMRERMESKSK